MAVAAGTTTVAEGDVAQPVSVTLTLTTTGAGPIELGVPVSVNLPGNADYSAVAATFAAGAVNAATASVSVAAVDDRRVEPAESFSGQALAVSNANGANVTATGTHTIAVNDNDSATVSVPTGTTTVGEGASQNVTATLTLTTPGTVGTAGLDVEVSANLPGNGDYTATPVTFLVGAASGETLPIVVTAVDDLNVEEATESFAGQALTITNANGATATAAGTQTIAVTDNDSASVTITAASGTTTVAEGGSTQLVEVTLTLTTTGTVGTAQLDVPVTANLPGNPDYTATAFTFPVGATTTNVGNVVVAAVNDALVEGTETFDDQALSVTTTASATATGTQDIVVTDNATRRPCRSRRDDHGDRGRGVADRDRHADPDDQRDRDAAARGAGQRQPAGERRLHGDDPHLRGQLRDRQHRQHRRRRGQ